MADEELLRKTRFFAQLSALDEDDNVVDEGFLASIRALDGYSGSKVDISPARYTRSTGVDSRDKAGGKNSFERSTHFKEKLSLKQIVNSPTTPKLLVEVQAPQRTVMHVVDVCGELPNSPRLPKNTEVIKGTTVITQTNVPVASRKRKRSAAIQQMPQSRKIFKDLRFFFLPNNDISKARRMRISKSIEYGAEWSRDWHDATHMIVDNDINFPAVLKFLGVAVFPSNIILVNENYPASCIESQWLVQHDQPSYRVKGFTQHNAIVSAEKQTSAESDRSLQLKPARKDEIVIEQQTPSRTEDSHSVSEISVTHHVGSQHVVIGAEKVSKGLRDDKDELEDCIAKAKAIAHLPLDTDDDDDLSRCSSSHSSSSDRVQNEVNSSKRRPAPPEAWQQKFQCMQSNAISGKNHEANANTIYILQEMVNYYDSISDQWRTMAYRKAITILRKQPKRITTKEEAQLLPGIGSRLAAKIEEIVVTSRLRRLDNLKLEPSDAALQTFLKVYGIGPSQAVKFVEQGFKTLDDLMQHANLNDNQRLGIQHYDDFLTRIPREEVAQLGAVVKHALLDIDAAFQVTIGGSYRRGAKDCGDIDLIITKPGASAAYLREVVVGQLVPRLINQGFLTACLAATSKENGTKWHGACVLPATARTASHPLPAKGTTSAPLARNWPWRRIDLLLVPWDEIGAAMIYFTGNDISNRSMRLLARKKGMRLNQRGLYVDVIRGKAQQKVTDGRRIEGSDEKRIFEALGVPWREPWERIC